MGDMLGYDLCTVNTLRFTNIMFSIGLYFTLVSLVNTLYPATKHDWRAKMYALTLAWFPVGFFYNFLYYTDPGSTWLVLQSYLLVKKKRYSLAGLVGMISLTFRQTNVIWLCLFMVVTIIDTLSHLGDSKKNEDVSASLYNPTCASIQQPGKLIQECALSQPFKLIAQSSASSAVHLQSDFQHSKEHQGCATQYFDVSIGYCLVCCISGVEWRYRLG